MADKLDEPDEWCHYGLRRAQAREQDRPTARQREQSRKRITLYNRAGKGAASEADSDVAEVQVSETRFKRLAKRGQYLRKLLANYADTVEKAERTGRPEIVALRVMPSGEIAIVPTAEPTRAVAVPAPAVPEGDVLDRALAAAHARGQSKVAEILKREDMLTAGAFGPLIDVSHETVNTIRKRFELLGLEGARRGVRYPRWQVTQDGLPLQGLSRLFAVLGEQPWTVYRFLRAAHGELGGRTAIEALKAGQLDAVLGVAQNQVAGRFA